MNKSQVVIGIDGSRAFLKYRTGIEEYSYQVISHLRSELTRERVIVYIRADQDVDFALPSNWRVKKLWAPRLWTQMRLSFEMLVHRPDVLFVPAHTVPLIHPANTVVVIHGLEYEICPESYSWWSRVSMRAAIRFSCRVAQTVICVSENTKRDVMRLYGTSSEKMRVVYEGYQKTMNPPSPRLRRASNQLSFAESTAGEQSMENKNLHNRDIKMNKQISFSDRCEYACGLEKDLPHPFLLSNTPYILFIGRLEERKNIVRCIEAFAMAKEKYHIPHTLVLAGKPGYGYDRIQKTINKYQSTKNKHKSSHPELVSGFRENTASFVDKEMLKQPARNASHNDAGGVQHDIEKDIIELGYVSEEEKWALLRRADIFFFATLYEGFGIPVLEAQSAGVPVITSNTSSLPEVAGEGALLVDPTRVEAIAKAMQSLISNQTLKSAILQKGAENVQRFSWEKCAREIGVLM